MKRFLYVITNKKTGDQYVGSSIRPRERWKSHCQALEGQLGDAIRKYGKEAFELETRGICRDSKSEERLCKKLNPKYNSHYMKRSERRHVIGCEIFLSEKKKLMEAFPGMSICSILKKIIREKI